MSIIERARRADGCPDLAITADLLDPGRVNGPSDKQRAAMLSASVAGYDIAQVRPWSGEGRA
jgi:hypothetical protein